MTFLARLSVFLLAAASLCPAADLTLTAIDGTTHRPLAAKDGKSALFFFVSPFCSTTKAFVKEMNQITADHAGKVSIFFIQCDPEVTRDLAIEHATLSEFKAPVLLDAAQQLTRQLQATLTPEAVLVAKRAQRRAQCACRFAHRGSGNVVDRPCDVAQRCRAHGKNPLIHLTTSDKVTLLPPLNVEIVAAGLRSSPFASNAIRPVTPWKSTRCSASTIFAGSVDCASRTAW